MTTTQITENTIRPVALLRAAANRISAYGLFQGEYWPVTPGGESSAYIEGDPCCALGALAVAARYDEVLLADAAIDTHPGLVAAVDAVAARVGELAAWNDSPSRTAADVTAVLRAAATDLTAPDNAGDHG
jgi:hypothetical protein